jgi:integrase
VSRVFKIQRSDGRARWYVCVTYRGEKYREVAGDTKQAALKRLRELEARLEKTGEVAEKKVPFDFLCKEYLQWATVNLAPRTRQEREYIIRVHLKKFFNGLVSDIDVRSLEAYKASRLQIPIAPISLNTHLKVLSCILKFGQENKLVAELPKIRRVKVPKKIPKFLSAEEIGRVLAAARPDVRPMLQLMIFTGLRKGEMFHLEWSDVDLENRLLHVRPKESWNPKTDNSARTIPLCEPAVEALQLAKVRAEKRSVKSSLVFPGRKGPLKDIQDSLNGACARAGVPRVHVHALRHTFGSQMAMAGADPFAIMKALGHADIKTTMIYVSLGKSHIRDQVDRLNAIAIPKSKYSPSRASTRPSPKDASPAA